MNSKQFWQIELMNVGRGKFCHVYIEELIDLSTAESFALSCCKKRLASKLVYLELLDLLVYGVYAGDRLVGAVKITCIPKEVACQARQKP